MVVHTRETLDRAYNREVIVPEHWLPPRFGREDWMWIKNIAQAGPNEDRPVTDVKVGTMKRLTCVHRTQPRRNFSVFYRRVETNRIMLLGVGQHNVNNRQYTMEWADGTRNRISLATRRRTGDYFMLNPIGGEFDFEMLDPLLRQFCRAKIATV